MVRTMLPKVLPPSYKGTAVRYVYDITVSIQWTYTIVENGHGPSPQQHTASVVSEPCVYSFPKGSERAYPSFSVHFFIGIGERLSLLLLPDHVGSSGRLVRL